MKMYMLEVRPHFTPSTKNTVQRAFRIVLNNKDESIRESQPNLIADIYDTDDYETSYTETYKTEPFFYTSKGNHEFNVKTMAEGYLDNVSILINPQQNM